MSAVKVCLLLLLAYNVVDCHLWGQYDTWDIETTGQYDRWDVETTRIVPAPSAKQRPSRGTRKTTTTEATLTENETTTTTQATTTEKQTTTSATPTTTTEEPANCDFSLYNKNDLEYMIDDIINKSDLIASVTSDFSTNASELSAKYLQELEDVYETIEKKAEKFGDVLKALDVNRDHAESLIQEMSGSVTKYQNNLKDFQKTNDTATQLLHKFQKDSDICELLCGKHIKTRTIEILRTSQLYSPKEYYCGSMSQVNGQTVANLNTYVAKLRDELTLKINNDTKYYRERVNNVSNELIKYALTKYNYNFYKVFDLQVKYQQIFKKISRANMESNINKIRQNVADLNSKLITFEDAVDRLGKYCRICDKDSLRSGDEIHAREIEKFDLLQEILTEKEKEITGQINAKYANTLKSLDDELNNPFKTSFMEKLNKTHADADIEIGKHEEEFKNLKDKVDQIPITEVAQIEQESEDLLKKIEKYIQLINGFVTK